MINTGQQKMKWLVPTTRRGNEEEKQSEVGWEDKEFSLGCVEFKVSAGLPRRA